MSENGTKRAKKFAAKHDPDTIMLRWKALRQFSEIFYSGAASTQEQTDQLIHKLIELFNIPYGKAGNAYVKLKKLIYGWNMFTDTQKDLLRQDWINEGLDAAIFDQLDIYVTEFYKTTEIQRLRTGYLYAFLNYYPRKDFLDETTLLTIEEILAYLLSVQSWGVLSNHLDVSYEKDKAEEAIPNPTVEVEYLSFEPQIEVSVSWEVASRYTKTIPNPICKLESLDVQPTLRSSVISEVPLKGLVGELRVGNICLKHQCLPIIHIITSTSLLRQILNPDVIAGGFIDLHVYNMEQP